MKKLKTINYPRLKIGDLYLFHTTNTRCPPQESLWGIFDKCTEGRIFLESSSHDLAIYAKWHPLPEIYRFCRSATRAELRDYVYNLAMFECRERAGL